MSELLERLGGVVGIAGGRDHGLALGRQRGEHARPVRKGLAEEAGGVPVEGGERCEQHGADKRRAERGPDRPRELHRRRRGAEAVLARDRLHRHLQMDLSGA